MIKQILVLCTMVLVLALFGMQARQLPLSTPQVVAQEGEPTETPTELTETDVITETEAPETEEATETATPEGQEVETEEAETPEEAEIEEAPETEEVDEAEVITDTAVVTDTVETEGTETEEAEIATPEGQEAEIATPEGQEAETEEAETVTPEGEATETEEAETATPEGDEDVNLLTTVQERGNLICGVNGGLPGFSNLEADGTYSGFDVDFCRALAAAIFGDPEAVEFRPLTTQERFTAVQTGEVDVLFRNTTWTLSRDTSVGMDFAPVTFYDGQGIMVPEELGITELEELENATICVQSGTTTELNLTDQLRARDIPYEPVVLDDIDTAYNTYDEGGCDAVTSDRSQLTARRTTLQDPDAHVILDVVLSSEPLAPAVSQGDSQWLDVVNWVVYATFQAERFGITSENIEEFMTTENPEIARFLGFEGELGTQLGLPDDFTIQIIANVGSYAEIYERNLGPDTPFDLDRGLNSVPDDGGLLFSPPFR